MEHGPTIGNIILAFWGAAATTAAILLWSRAVYWKSYAKEADKLLFRDGEVEKPYGEVEKPGIF